jgi:hypothetical protein
MPFRRILFPIDFSKAAVAMVPAVSAMARRFDATVTVLNAFYEVPKYVLMPSPLAFRFPILQPSRNFVESARSISWSFPEHTSQT